MNPKAGIRSATLAIVLTTVFVIASELSSGVKGFFALFGHHWIGKSIVLLIVFAIGYLVLIRSDRDYALKDVWWLVAAVITGGLAIACFYAWHAGALLSQ